MWVFLVCVSWSIQGVHRFAKRTPHATIASMASPRELTATALNDLLQEARGKLTQDNRTRFRIICLSTDLSWERLLQIVRGYFDVTEQGVFHELYKSHTKHNKEFHVYLYLYEHPDTGAPIIFTVNSYDDFRRTAKSMIEGTEDLYTLWLRPSEVSELREELLDKQGVRLTGFDYDTFGKDQKHEAQRRPGHKRSGSHDSDDAMDMLEDWKLEYGITPTQLRFSLPDKGEFHFSNDGEFVMKTGDTEFLYNEIVESALQKAHPLSTTAQASELRVVTEGGIDQIQERPLEMTIGDVLNYEDVDDLISEMKADDFYPYSYQAAPGSLLLSGRIVDERNGGMISVSTDGETMTLLPRYESGFDSLLRFYRFIVEEVDPDTSIQLVEG